MKPRAWRQYKTVNTTDAKSWREIAAADIPAQFTVTAEAKRLLLNAIENISLENVQVKAGNAEDTAKNIALVGAEFGILLNAVIQLEGRVIDLETRLAALESPQQGS
ncbi:hypothetical protein [Segniliparus rotundus]|nr:hypothetical protein [Segniliparus rotundus]